MPLLLLQFTRGVAARSWQKYVPPYICTFVSTTASSANLISSPQLRRPLSQYHHSSDRPWQQWTRGLHLQHAASNPGVVSRASLSSSGVQMVYTLNPGKLSGLMFHRNISGLGQSWMSRYTKRDLSLLRPTRRTASCGGFRGSSIRHFGQGPPLAFLGPAHRGGNYIDPKLALGALIAANFGVFFLWRSLGGRFMESNFVVSAQALREGRLHTVVTSIFSQFELQHLLSNMIGLYFFGSEIGSLFGGQKLILLYLTGGVVGTLTHLAYWSYIKPWVEGYPRRFSRNDPGLLGSSGAVNAIILLDILLFPNRIIYMNLIIPVPAALFGLVIIGSDLWAATAGSKTGTSPAAHLGGAFVGAFAWLKWR